MSSGYEDLEELKDKLEQLISDLDEMINSVKEMLNFIDTIEWKLGFKEDESEHYE